MFLWIIQNHESGSKQYITKCYNNIFTKYTGVVLANFNVYSVKIIRSLNKNNKLVSNETIYSLTAFEFFPLLSQGKWNQMQKPKCLSKLNQNELLKIGIVNDDFFPY